MKKLFIFAAFAVCSLASMAQLNVQLHGDLGRAIYPNAEANRQMFTLTTEFFHADKLGSTFCFIDVDFREKLNGEAENSNNGAVGAYMEISREFTFAKVKKSPNHSFAAHMEFDGGLNTFGPFQPAFLVGPAWNWHSNDFSKTFSLQLMYKQFLNGGGHKAHSSAQLTAVWNTTFAHGWLSFNGFADLWYGHNAFDGDGRSAIFLTEPQLWVNVMNKAKTKQKLAIGTEWEMSTNFIYPSAGSDRFYFNPTLAIKWTIF